MRICFVSDTHTYHKSVSIPECDLLIHSGDATYTGRQDEVESFGKWMRELPVQDKIFVPGNHDKSFEFDTENALKWLAFDQQHKKDYGNCYYLQQESVEIDGLKIYGDGSTPRFGFGWAFNVDRGLDLEETWKNIPDDADVVVTHGPPFGILDYAQMSGDQVGCRDLMARLYQIKPLIHSFGHIHESYGTKEVPDLPTVFINASTCTLQYRPTNDPIVAVVEKVAEKWEVISFEMP